MIGLYLIPAGKLSTFSLPSLSRDRSLSNLSGVSRSSQITRVQGTSCFLFLLFFFVVYRSFLMPNSFGAQSPSFFPCHPLFIFLALLPFSWLKSHFLLCMVLQWLLKEPFCSRLALTALRDEEKHTPAKVEQENELSIGLRIGPAGPVAVSLVPLLTQLAGVSQLSYRDRERVNRKQNTPA